MLWRAEGAKNGSIDALDRLNALQAVIVQISHTNKCNRSLSLSRTEQFVVEL